jgi:hypothetical protein
MENEKFQGMVIKKLEENEKFQGMVIKEQQENRVFQNTVLEHMARMTQDLTMVKCDLTDIKIRVTKVELVLEHDVPQKFDALFDGQKLMQEQLNRIEQKVDRHEDIIIRKVK